MNVIVLLFVNLVFVVVIPVASTGLLVSKKKKKEKNYQRPSGLLLSSPTVPFCLLPLPCGAGVMV